jgi:non-specific serine/threonine protein kinase/serine/threonine-protein kinase
MTPERWQQIKRLCQLALDREVDDRAAFLAEACTDAPLRAEVESLLRHATAGENALKSPIWDQLAIAPIATRIDATHASGPYLPPQIGRYRVLRLIGEGGMGTVYEAEQDSPRRRVALKVVRTGLSTPEIRRRFERESQALALLQHPGIAQVYDAGAAETGCGSQPYFAMEFIQGHPLKEYVASHSLEVPDRLELVAKICDAVQHAHDRGVIHRDLKPGNILVDEMGQPKVLDFGVARMLEGQASETLHTNVGQVVGTPAYMSPEQVLADPKAIDARCDVYALGVVLYELLAERLPYDVSGRQHEAAHAILEEDPQPLSTVNRLFKGDIETIVAKALEKDRARRYPSAAALAVDLRRYLINEPIAARPATAVYHLQKFVRRHTALVAGAASVFVALTAGTVVSAWEALRARAAERAAIEAETRTTTERDQALRDRNRALAAEALAQKERNRAVAAQEQAQQDRGRAVAESQRASTEAAISQAVRAFLQSDLLAQSSAREQSGPDSKPDPDLKVRTALDRAAARVTTRFRGQPLVEASVRQTIGAAYEDLGLYPQAREQFDRALRLRRVAVGPEHELALESLKNLAQLTLLEGRYPQAEPLYLQAIQGLERRRGATDPSVLEARAQLAELYTLEGRYVRAESLILKTLDTQRRVLGPSDPATLASLLELGRVQVTVGKYADAEASLRSLIGASQRTKGAEHPDTLDAEDSLATALVKEVKYDEAETLYKRSLEAERRVLGADHPNTLSTVNNLALLYKTEGKYAEAEPLYRDTLEARRRVFGEEHPDTLTAMNNLGALYVAQKRYADAEALLARLLTVRKRVLGPEHPNTLNTMVNLGQVYFGEGRVLDAEPLYSDVLSIRRRVLGGNHPDTLFIMANLGVLYTTEGRFDDAERLVSHVRDERRRTIGDAHPNTAQVTDNLGQIYLRRGEPARAQDLFAEALEYRRRALGIDQVDTLRSQLNLAEAYRQAGDTPRGEALLDATLTRARAALGRDNDVTVMAVERLAEARRRQGNLAEARTLLTEALQIRQRVLGSIHPATIEDTVKIGGVLYQEHQYTAVEAMLKPVVAADGPVMPWILFEAKSVLGAAIAAQGRFAEAESHLLEAYDGLVEVGPKIPADNRPTIADTADRLVTLYQAWGKEERAAFWAKRRPS